MSNLQIITTQNVKLYFTTASVGERILAYGADLLIKIAYIVVAYILFFQIFNVKDFSGQNNILYTAIVCLLSLPVLFYTLVSETLMEGQTLGKKLVKIKVVKIDGYQAGFFDFLIRWIFCLVDINMGFAPGLVTMMITKHTQRLGDMAAGTSVISEKSKYNISHTILMDVDEKYEPYFAQNMVMLFSDNDMRIIKENAEIAFTQDNFKLLTQLVRKIESVMNIRNPFKSERELLNTLQKDYNYYTGK
ncbi:MAG: RDD family protein [Paludibacter sp.]|nr:RDD family protein [Paludibacter sp.]